VAVLFFGENVCSTEGATLASLIAGVPAVLFFVRVNQVLVRLWARAMEAGHCLVFVPLSG
jgi:hypothetical protein